MSDLDRPRKHKRNALTFDKHWNTDTRTNEEVLGELFTPSGISFLFKLLIFTAAQVRSWRSDVYAHFKHPTIIQEDNIIKYRFTCKT